MVSLVDDYRIVMGVAGEERVPVPPQPVIGGQAIWCVPWWVGRRFLGAVGVDEDHLGAGAFQDRDVDVELVPKFLLPLPEGALGGQDEEPVHFALVNSRLEQYSSLNGLAQSHLIGDENPVGAWSCCPLDPEVFLVGPELRGDRLGRGRRIVGDGVPDAGPEQVSLFLGCYRWRLGLRRVGGRSDQFQVLLIIVGDGYDDDTVAASLPELPELFFLVGDPPGLLPGAEDVPGTRS